MLSAKMTILCLNGVCGIIVGIFLQQTQIELKLDDYDAGPLQLEKIARMNNKQLEELRKDASPSISLRAAYVLAKMHNQKKHDFTKLMKGHLGVPMPQWWVKELKEVMDTKDRDYVANVDSSQLSRSSRLIVGDFVFEADPKSSGRSYAIVAHNRITSKLLWSGKVWAVCRETLAGLGSHQIELVTSKDVLVVFGAESHGLYVEAFELKNGKPVIRFCTHYLLRDNM
ncbi:hypothetical protein BH10PLA2_BH10PLA2_23320 [soil metagenome]